MKALVSRLLQKNPRKRANLDQVLCTLQKIEYNLRRPLSESFSGALRKTVVRRKFNRQSAAQKYYSESYLPKLGSFDENKSIRRAADDTVLFNLFFFSTF